MAHFSNLAIHVCPGGTVGVNPRATAQPHDIKRNRTGTVLGDWAFCKDAFGSTILENGVDVARGLAGFRARFGQVALDAVAGVGIFGSISAGAMSTLQHFNLGGSLFTGAITSQALLESFGYWFIETEAFITTSATPGVGSDFAFIMSPSWCSGLGGKFFRTSGFGICWTRNTGNNYQLFIADQSLTVYTAIADTGVKALDEIHHIRCEYGYDSTVARLVIRAIIDGIKVAEFVGPFVGVSVTPFGQGAFVGLDGCENDLGQTLEAYFGFGNGILTEEETVAPPVPPPTPPSSLTACSVIVPVFTNQTPGIITAFAPCSGSGQPGVSGQSNCG